MKHDMKGNKKEPQNRSEQGLNQKEQPLGVRASGVLLLSFIGGGIWHSQAIGEGAMGSCGGSPG